MEASIGDITKNKRGRKPTTGTREGVLVRLPPDLLSGLDSLAAEQADTPSRPETIRRLLTEVLTAKGYLPTGRGSAEARAPEIISSASDKGASSEVGSDAPSALRRLLTSFGRKTILTFADLSDAFDDAENTLTGLISGDVTVDDIRRSAATQKLKAAGQEVAKRPKPKGEG